MLVLVVMGLFFGLRFSFWVALGLPVSFLGTIFAMQLMGLTINMITMVALLVAIGLLMDDSIVISENIVRRRLAGEAPLQAAINGVAQVGPGVLASFLTTVMIVGPLGLMAGQIGAVLKFLPVVLVITLIVSLMEAFLVLPNHLAHALRKDMRPNRINRVDEWSVRRLARQGDRAAGAAGAAVSVFHAGAGGVPAAHIGHAVYALGWSSSRASRRWRAIRSRRGCCWRRARRWRKPRRG